MPAKKPHIKNLRNPIWPTESLPPFVATDRKVPSASTRSEYLAYAEQQSAAVGATERGLTE